MENLLAFLGYDVTLSVGECELGGEGTGLEYHLYNVIRTERGTAIYDPTNPSRLYGPNGESVGFDPAMYRLSDEQIEAWEAGDAVKVSHLDFDLVDGHRQAKASTTRTYRRNVER